MKLGEPDTTRCERCRVYWQPDLAAANLWHHLGFLVCVDRQACTERLTLSQSLDRLLAPLRPGDGRPVLAFSPGPSGPSAGR